MLRGIGVAFIAIVVVGVVFLAGWYQIDGQPLPETGDFLSGPGFSVEASDGGGFVFRPNRSNRRGLVIMHGALIRPQSYAKTASYFAKRGYTVLLPSGAARLSIAAVGSAAEQIRDFDIDDWYFIGHSMGGLSTMELIRRHGIDARAIALWASAMPADYTDIGVPILYIWGDNDGLLPIERLKESQANLPEAVRYETLEGANHKDFAMYSHQFFDNDSIIGWEAQIDFANTTTAAFFEGR